MAAQIDEVVLYPFRASENDLRDIDSIVRRHCQAIKYYVYQGSALGGYDTSDIEDVLKERNGAETRIRSIKLHATGRDGLKFNIDFDDDVAISGECEDRARLVILATEARAVIRDRLKTRRLSRSRILQALGITCLIVGYLGFQGVQNSSTSRFNAAQARREAPSTAEINRQFEADQQSEERLLSQTEAAISSHNLNAEVSLLLENQVLNLQQEVGVSPGTITLTQTPQNPPGWETSYWLLIAVSIGAAGTAVGFGYLTIADDKSVFLIGDEKARQENAERRRRNILWGIGVALIVGIVAGYISSLR